MARHPRLLDDRDLRIASLEVLADVLKKLLVHLLVPARRKQTPRPKMLPHPIEREQEIDHKRQKSRDNIFEIADRVSESSHILIEQLRSGLLLHRTRNRSCLRSRLLDFNLTVTGHHLGRTGDRRLGRG